MFAYAAFAIGHAHSPVSRAARDSRKEKMMEKTPAMVSNPPLPRQYGCELLVIERGEGVWLEDTAGKRYLDFAGGIAVDALGHPHVEFAVAQARGIDFQRAVEERDASAGEREQLAEGVGLREPWRVLDDQRSP